MGSSAADDVPSVLTSPTPVSAEERIKLKTRAALGAKVGEGGVGVGEAARDQAGAAQPGQEQNTGSEFWRNKAAERLGLVRTGAAGKRDGAGGNSLKSGGGMKEEPRQIPAEVVYKARLPRGGRRPGSGASTIPASEGGSQGGDPARGGGGDGVDEAASAATKPFVRCNVTMVCHACPQAALRDAADYCLATGWRQQVRCMNERGVEVEVRFESCEFM